MGVLEFPKFILADEQPVLAQIVGQCPPHAQTILDRVAPAAPGCVYRARHGITSRPEGIEPGDVIVAIDGAPATAMNDWGPFVGRGAELTVWRPGKGKP